MSEETHIFDPQGEVIIILQCQDYAFAPWNECETECEPIKPHADEGKRFVWSDSGPPAEEPAAFDEQLEEAYPNATLGNQLENACGEHDKVTTRISGNEDHVEEDCCRIQVSAKHLILSSPVFKKTLTGGWKEGFHLLKKGSVEITTSGWDLEAFLILMHIFHCQPQNLPQRISLELLAKVAVLADYYECQTVVRFFADKWIDVLKKSPPTVYSRDLMLWIWVSGAFRLCPQFENSTLIAISESNNLITNLGLPIPGKVIDEMNSRRHNAISVIFSTLTERRDAFLSGSRGCSFECSSIMFGALTKHMHSSALLSPQPSAPFIGQNYNGLMKTVHTFKSPRWSSPNSRSYSYQHSCVGSSFPSPIIISEGAVKGLSSSSSSSSRPLIPVVADSIYMSLCRSARSAASELSTASASTGEEEV